MSGHKRAFWECDLKSVLKVAQALNSGPVRIDPQTGEIRPWSNSSPSTPGAPGVRLKSPESVLRHWAWRGNMRFAIRSLITFATRAYSLAF